MACQVVFQTHRRESGARAACVGTPCGTALPTPLRTPAMPRAFAASTTAAGLWWAVTFRATRLAASPGPSFGRARLRNLTTAYLRAAEARS